jgi:LEA14-like dessication related protein
MIVHRLLAASLVVLLLSLGGCNSLLAGLDKPTAEVKAVQLASLSLERASLLFDLEVANPYAIAVPLLNIDYTLASGSAPFASGHSALSGTVPAHGTRRVRVPVDVSFADAVRALGGVKPGSVVPYNAAMKVSVDAPTVGTLSLPFETQGSLPIPAVPRIELAGVDFKSLSLTDATAVLRLNVTNTNSFNVDLDQLAYSLRLGGQPIADASVASGARLGPGQLSTLTVPLSFSPSKLGLAALSMLRSAGADYELRGSFKASTPFGPIDMPYTQAGKTPFTR